jgi:hypothetical protein
MDLVKTYYCIYSSNVLIQNILLFFMTGMDLLGCVHPLALARGGMLFFMIKAKKAK